MRSSKTAAARTRRTVRAGRRPAGTAASMVIEEVIEPMPTGRGRHAGRTTRQQKAVAPKARRAAGALTLVRTGRTTKTKAGARKSAASTRTASSRSVAAPARAKKTPARATAARPRVLATSSPASRSAMSRRRAGTARRSRATLS